MKGREIKAFQVESIKLSIKAVNTGVFTLNPSVIYVDDFGEIKTCKPPPIKIIVKPKIASPKENMFVEPKLAKIIFKSEAAQKAFDFLINAFLEDYAQKRLPKERCGWRTLMDIVKQAGVSQYSIYKSKGRSGLALSELVKLGLVEVRVFLGERGRGGKIRKIRISYDRKNVIGYIDHLKNR